MSRAAVIELQLERSLSVVIKHDVTIISCLHYVSDWCNRFNSSNPIFALIDKYLQNYSVVSLFPLPSFLIWLNIPEKFLYFLPDMRHPVVSADLMLLVWLGLPRQSEGANSWQPMGGLDTQAEQSSSASLRDCMTQPSLEQLRVATSGSSPQSMWENSQQTADSSCPPIFVCLDWDTCSLHCGLALSPQSPPTSQIVRLAPELELENLYPHTSHSQQSNDKRDHFSWSRH